MPEDTTLRKPGEGAPQTAGKPETTDKKPERSDSTPDLSKELEKERAARAAEKAEQDKKIAELKFENDFKDISAQYPHAAELKAKIKERVDAGMPIQEAAVVVLHGEKKLVTKEEVETSNAAAASLGGSADIQVPKGQKKPEEMTTEELRAALVTEEAKGTFGLKEY